MQMSFSELVRHSRDFSTISWPRGFNLATLQSGVNALLHSITQLTAGRENQFLHKTVAVVSPRADDWLLASLLTCFGARVHFLCPTRVSWDPELYPTLFRALRDHI